MIGWWENGTVIDWIQSKDILTIVPTRFRLHLTFREKTYRGVVIRLRYVGSSQVWGNFEKLELAEWKFQDICPWIWVQVETGSGVISQSSLTAASSSTLINVDFPIAEEFVKYIYIIIKGRYGMRFFSDPKSRDILQLGSMYLSISKSRGFVYQRIRIYFREMRYPIP